MPNTDSNISADINTDLTTTDSYLKGSDKEIVIDGKKKTDSELADKRKTVTDIGSFKLDEGPASIKAPKTEEISDPYDTLEYQVAQQQEQANKEAVKDFYKVQLSRQLPFLPKKGNLSKYSVDPRVIQTDFKSGVENMWNAFRKQMEEIRQSRNYSDLADAQNEIDVIDEQLEHPNLTQEKRQELNYRRNAALLELDEVNNEIEEQTSDVDKFDTSLTYNIKNILAQSDEGTGNPFIPSDYGIGTYLKYEMPQDFGGSYFNWKAQYGTIIAAKGSQMLASKALGALGLSGPWGLAASIIGAGVGMLGSHIMREQESEAEAGEAYKSKIRELNQQFVDQNGRQPTAEERRKIRLKAHDGLEALRQANMNLLIGDYAQTALLALPWVGKLRSVLSTNNALKLGVLGTGSVAAQSYLESIEEGNQHIWQEEYKAGTLEETANLIDGAKQYMDTSLRSSMAMLGIGEKDLMNSKEFGNVTRAGAIMGGGMSALNSMSANIRDIFVNNKNKKEVRGLIDLETGYEKDMYRHRLIKKFMGKGTTTDKVSNLIFGRDRTSEFLNIMEDLKGSKYAQKNDISDQDIDNEIASFKSAARIINMSQRDKNLSQLNEEELVQAGNILATLDSRSRFANNLIKQREKELSNLMSELSDSPEDLGENFTNIIKTKTKLDVLNDRLKNVKNLKEYDIPVGEDVYSSYIKILNDEIKKTEQQLESSLESSTFNAKDLTTSMDEQLKTAQGNLFDAQMERTLHANEYIKLSRNTKELADRAKAQIRADENAKREADRQASEFYDEFQASTSEPTSMPGGFTVMQDDQGNTYTFEGKRTGDRYEFTNKADDSKVSLTQEQIEEKGMTPVEGLTEEAIPTTEILGFEEQAETAEESQAYMTEYKNDLRETMFGTQDESGEVVSGEASTGESAQITQPTESESVERTINRYTNTTLNESTPAVVFDDRKIDEVPAAFDGKIGTVSIDPETNQLKFKDVEGNENNLGNIYTVNNTKMKDMGVTVLDSFLLDIQIVSEGRGFDIHGTRYNNIQSNPYDAVREKNGVPVAVTLRDENNEDVTFTNPVIVKELAYAISLNEAAENKLIETIKSDANEDFVVFTDPDTNEQFAIYKKRGRTVVKGKAANGRYNKYVNKSRREEIKDKYTKEMRRALEAAVALQQQQQIGSQLNKEDLQNALRELDIAIRQATPREINISDSAAELSATEEEAPAKSQETDESKTRGQDRQQQIIEDKSQERADDEITSQQNESTQDKDKVGRVSVEMSNDTPTRYRGQKRRGKDDVSSSLSFYGVNDQTTKEKYYNETDEYVSTHDLKDHSVEFSVDTEFSEFWDTNPGLKEIFSRTDMTEQEVNEVLDKYLTDDDTFQNIIDTLPIKGYLKDSNNNTVGKVNLHRSDYDNIKYPREIENMPTGQEKTKAAINYKIKEKKRTRQKRVQILKHILQGNRPRIYGLERTKGIEMSSDKKGASRNENISKVFNISAKEAVLGIADGQGIIRMASGKDMPGLGSPGNVFLETSQTVNGAKTNVKLNPSKLSEEHARILFQSIITGYNKGYRVEYPGNEVKGLSVGETINLLALEGKEMTKVENPIENEHLLDKQLYIEEDTLYYGRNSMDLTSKNSLNDFTKQEIDSFLNWATTHKNYVAILPKLGKTFKTSFKIGNMKAVAGKTKYEDFLINNNLIMTDMRQPLFHAPVLVFDINSLQTNQKVAEGVMGNDIPTKPGKDEKPSKENTEDKANEPQSQTGKEGRKKMFGKIKTVEDLTKLEDGTEIILKSIYSDDKGNRKKSFTLFGSISTKQGKKVFNLEVDPNNVPEAVKAADGIPLEENGQAIIDTYVMGGVSRIGYFYYSEPTDNHQNNMKNPKKGNDDPEGSSPFRLKDKSKERYKRINLEKELKWLRSKLPNENVHVIDNLINIMSSGQEAFGQTREDMIILSRAAEFGTAYHEAFHRVSLSLLTPEQRQEIYNKARKRYGMENASDLAVEEALAEHFRNFVIAQENNKQVSEPNAIKRFFQRLWDIIYSLFTGGNIRLGSIDIDNLFTAIQQGRFKSAKPKVDKQSPLLRGPRAYLTAEGYSSDMQRTITKNLVFIALDKNGVRRVEDIESKLSFEPVKSEIRRKSTRMAYNAEYFEKAAENATTDKEKEFNQSEASDARELEELYDNILDNFEEFQSLAEDYLISLNIIRDKEDYIEYEYESGMGQSEFEKYNKAPFQFDGRDNIRSDIKMLIMTLPESYEQDSKTGMYQFVDFTTTWNKVLHDFHNVSTTEELMQRLEAKSENYIPYQILLKRLSEDNGENLKTQFLSSVKMHKNEFVNMYYTDRKGYRFWFGDAEIQSAARRYTQEWGERFATSGMVDKDNNVKLDKMKDLNNRYQNLIRDVKSYDRRGEIENFNKAVANTVKLLTDISIPMDKNTLFHLLDQNETAANREEALKEFVVGTADETRGISNLFSEDSTLYRAAYYKQDNPNYPKKINGDPYEVSELFLNESVIRNTIANAFATYNPEMLSATILGPEGNPYYKYMSNSYMTDIIRNINKSSDHLEKLSQVEFNKNSYFLSRLLADSELRKNFTINTFSAFVRNYGDRGRSYESVNKIEDFLARVHAIKDRKLPLPTLADRSSFYFYSGIEPIEFKFNINNEGKLTIPSNSEIISIISGYIRDEQNRIEVAKRQIDNAIETGDSSHLVENFHYQFTNSLPDEIFTSEKSKFEKVDNNNYKIFKDENGNYVGNGTKFQHFDGLNGKKNIDTRKEATNIIKESIKDTIKLASELGAVNATISNNTIQIENNKYLDTNLVEEVAKEYNNNEQHAIKDILANFAVNNIVSTVETDKIFLQDPAFYKDSADKVKRSTILGATGNNLRTDFPAGHELHGETSYNSITLDSSILESVYYPQLRNLYIDNYQREGYSEKKAIELAEERLSGYKEVDQTDAQVFISPEMHRSVKMRMGEWDIEEQRTYDALQNGETNASEISMEPIKLTYFGPSFENSLGIPIYDKMSMATLHRQAIKGTELEKLLDRMELKGDYAPGAKFNKDGNLQKVHQVKFDSAVKVGNRERFQFFTDNTQQDMNDLTKAPVYGQQFEYLRRQALTEPHEESEIALGTQVKKVPMYNVQKDAEYTLMGNKVTGNDVLDTINRAIGVLSDYGYNNLMKEVGVNPETMQIEDETKLVLALREDAIRSNSPDNVINALTPDENGNFPEFDSLPNTEWIENRVVSMVNKRIIDLMMPGKSFIQMSNFGMRQLTDKNISDFADKITWLQEAKKDLKYYQANEDGSLEPMETIVSVDMYRKVIPNYDKKTFEEKKAFLQQNPEIMGYRVPTQGPNSVVRLKVVGFLPETYGDTIVLPAEFTTLTGSDFDIDKLFAVRYSYEKDSEGNAVKTPFLTDGTTKFGKTSTLEERARKYARNDALVDEINEINKSYGRAIQEVVNSREISKEELDYIKEQLPELEEMAYITRNETMLEEVINKRDTIDAIHTSLQDLKEGIQQLKEQRENDIEQLVDEWVNNNLDEFADRPILKQNTSDALENLVLDSYSSILSDPKHSVQVSTPLDAFTGQLKDIAKEVRGREEDMPASYSLMPRFQTDVKDRYISGKQGIAPFALNNVHHVIGQIANLYVNKDLGLPKVDKAAERSRVDYEMPMNFADGDGGRTMRPEFRNKSTMELIKSGDRIATSRSPRAQKGVKRGDIIKFTDKQGNEVYVKATTDEYPVDSIHPERWSELEGWSTDVYVNIQNKGYKQFQFKRLTEQEVEGLDNITDLSVHKGVDNEYVSDWMSALISAHVDVAKDPYIFDININKFTQNVANFLVRAGLGKNTFYFLSQPILKDVAYYYSLRDSGNSGITGIDTSHFAKARNKYKEALQTSLDKEKKMNIQHESTTGDPFNQERLRKDASGDHKINSEYFKRQLEILDKFSEIKKYADGLNEALMASRVDTRRYGKNLVEIKNFENRYIKVLKDNLVHNFKESFDNTFVGDLMNNALPAVREILANRTISATEGFNYFHNQGVMYAESLYSIDPDTQRNVHNYLAKELHASIISRFFADETYGMGITSEKLSTMLKGKNSVARRVYNVKYNNKEAYPDLQDNRLLNSLIPKLAQDESQFDGLTMTTVDIKEKWDQDELTKSWKQLLSYPDDTIRQLGEDLIVYSFYTSGFNKNINSFFEYMPFEHLRDKGFSDYVRSQINALNHPDMYGDLVSLMEDVYKNNSDNDYLVPTVTFTDVAKSAVLKKGDVPALIKMRESAELNKGKTIKGDTAFAPFIKSRLGNKTYLYEYIGFTANDNLPMYRVTDTKGYKNRGYVVKEYGVENTIFDNNKHKAANMEKAAKDQINFRKVNGEHIFGDFIPSYNMDNFIHTYKADITDIAQENISDSQSTTKQRFEFKRIKGNKNFTVEEVMNSNRDLTREQAEVLRNLIREGKINNNC